MPMTCPSALRRASVVLAAVLLAGCTGETAPAPTAPATSAAPPVGPTPSASPSASSTAPPPASPTGELTIEPITTPPPVPADLRTPGQVGSKAVVEYFVALYGYTLNTGDTSLLRGISTPTCEYCNAFVENVEETRQSGWNVVGSGLTIELAKLYGPESSENRHVWLMDVVVAPALETPPDGEPIERPREVHTTALIAVWTGDSWQIGARRSVVESEASD